MNRFLKGVVLGSAVLLLLAALLLPAEVAVSAFQRRLRPKRVNELFNKNCARCHGADGRGDTALGETFQAPDFTDPEWWKENPDKTSTRAMRLTITRGKADMPAFGKKLTKAEVNLLINRVRAFRKPK
jgi:mono/diheme cytochrome c family protein